jgi:hypothetical protein
MSIVWDHREPVRREDKPADPKPGEPGYSFRERYERMCREIADENEQAQGE